MRLSSLCLPPRGLLAACAGLGFCVLATPVFSASFSTIYTFTPATDGNAPQSELTQGTDLKLYGTNSLGGPFSTGSVFRVNPDGSSYTGLSFFGPATTGLQPNGVVQGSDGYFYGTTYGGGANGFGLLFKIQTAGQLVKLASFATGDPGANPAATLTFGLDGYLYGTAQLGGLNNDGTVFRADPTAGTVTTVSAFSGGIDGLYPESDLTQAADGNFYGTTANGGAANAGTIFRVTPAGVRTTIYTFLGTTDGSTPLRGVVAGRDGYLYGIAVKGGATYGGTIFRVATDGTFTVLYSFLAALGSPYTAQCRLVQASDGNFYGTTNLGGTFNDGTIFKVTPTGGFTLLYNFTGGTDGAFPVSGLVQAADGKLYGTTSGQGSMASGAGTIYRLDLDLTAPTPLPLLFTPATVSAGDTVTLKGDNFLGVTSVLFPSATGSVAATSFTVLSKTTLQAVVPTGAVTGAVTVENGVLLAATPAALTVNLPPVVVTPPAPDPTPTPTPTGGLPEVSITAPDTVAVEGSSNYGKFKVKRQGGDLTLPLTIVFKVKGSATRGDDYNLHSAGETLASVTNSVTIPANKSAAAITVEALADDQAEFDETVIIKLKPGANYAVGTLNKATVIIADDN